MASIILGTLLFTSIGLAMADIVEWMHHTRKRLLKQLNDYFNGRPIPKSISKSHLFKRVLEYGQ